MLLNFFAVHEQSTILLAFARLSVRFEEKAAAASSTLELCTAQLWVAEASYACGLQKSATYGSLYEKKFIQRVTLSQGIDGSSARSVEGH